MTPPSRAPDPFPAAGDTVRATDHASWVAFLYGELRALAQSELESERPGHTLSATALVNEVYLKLARGSAPNSQPRPAGPPIERGMFFGLAAQAMRQILVDHARGKGRQKRGDGQPVAGGESLGLVASPDADGSPLDAVALDEALHRLAVEHEQAARVVELRFFAGLTDRATGECLGINERTVRRHWTFAKAWLAREMNPDDRTPQHRPGSSA